MQALYMWFLTDSEKHFEVFYIKRSSGAFVKKFALKAKNKAFYKKFKGREKFNDAFYKEMKQKYWKR